MSKFDIIKHQFKGAGKLFFILNLAIFCINLWVLKDQRHISFQVLGANCYAAAMTGEKVEAFETMVEGK